MKNESHTLAARGFDLLALLALCDGNYDAREKARIVEYVKDHFDENDDFSYHTRITTLTKKTTEEQIQLFIAHAGYFQEHGTTHTRKTLLDLLERLVAADRKISPAEQARIDIIRNYWRDCIDTGQAGAQKTAGRTNTRA